MYASSAHKKTTKNRQPNKKHKHLCYIVDVSVRDGGGEVNKWIDKSSEQVCVR